MKTTLKASYCAAFCSVWAVFGASPSLAADPPASAASAPATNASPAVTQDNVEFTIGPNYAPAPELTVREGVPKGTIHQFTMKSEESKIYPGIVKMWKPGRYDRKVAVYIPSQYVPGTPAPFIVAHDGLGYLGVLPKILDNMINDHRLPVMIAVMMNSGGSDGKGSERGLEYDTVSGVFAEFIQTEVLPRISKEYNITFTSDPDGRATMGGSSGGAAAFTMGWFHPEWYHRILTYSGTYVAQESPDNPATPRGAWEYHDYLIGASARKPLRLWLEVSEHDNGWNQPESTFHNWVMANQRMEAALKAKGYTYRYVYALKAGHTDGRVTRQTLPGALEWLWEGYQPKP